MNNKRIWEIDFLRGIALILMMIFHLLYDLNDFFNIPIPSWNGFWYYEGKVSAILFMLLAGISSTFSKNNFKRGLRVFIIGMGLTIVTYLIMPSEYIRFGILHLMGVGMIIYHFIRVIPIIHTSILSIFIIILGYIFSNINMSTWLLIPLGITDRNFVSMDYYPLFPWLAVFLTGSITGRILYKEKRSILQKTYGNDPVTFLGRHSLMVYLIHQPVILLILYLIFI
ncbi:MAG: DUF1624 domain-containing protein [Epulopiscium sp.]|nr:DUF1624 domain-containing protein [Candidatus Epulonipiscium sp.]